MSRDQLLQTHRPSRKEHRIGGGKIVDFPVPRHHNDEDNDVHPRQGTEAAPFSVKEEVHEPGNPERPVDVVHTIELTADKLPQPYFRVLKLAGVVHELKSGKPLRDFPDDMRKENEERDQRARPERPRREMLPPGGEEESACHPGAHEPHRILVQESESDHESKREPEFRRTSGKNNHGDGEGGRPEQYIERVHGKRSSAPEQRMRGND